MVTSRQQLIGQLQRPGQRPQTVELMVNERPVLTRDEQAAGIQWVDGRYEPGDVNRYGANTIPGTTDMTLAFQAAFDASGESQGVIVRGTHLINGVINVTKDNTSVHFDGPTINVGDTGTSGVLTNTATGRMGFLFREADNLRITGSANLIGQGTVGSSSLAGMVFDTCDNAQVEAAFYYENMAAGRFVMWCDHGSFGDISAYRMNGLQTFEEPPTNTAGTAEVVIGCYASNFGTITSRENYKPIRYLSVAFPGNPPVTGIDNELCSFGFVTGTAATSTIEGFVTAVRSGKNCVFEGGAGFGFPVGFLFERNAGDDDFSNDGNVVHYIAGDYPSTGASVDAVISHQTSSGSLDVGSNTVLKVDASCSGEFGIFVNSGNLSVHEAIIIGTPTRSVVGLDCDLHFNKLTVSNFATQAVAIGRSCNFSADFIDIQSGSTGSASSAIRYDPVFGTGSVGSINIGKIKYRHNGVDTDHLHVYMDLTNGFESVNIGSIDGTGSTSQARFANDTGFSLIQGRWASSAIPTTGTYSVGSVLLNSAPADGEPHGWQVTVAGTPGTWDVTSQVGYRSGSGSPSASVTPNFVGEEWLDTTGNQWYKSYGLVNTNWAAI